MGDLRVRIAREHAPAKERVLMQLSRMMGSVAVTMAAITGCGGSGDTGDGAADCSASNLAACAYASTGACGELPLVQRAVPYTDVLGETRTVEIAIHRPDGAPQPWPVIVWSHGGAAGVSSPVGVGAEWSRVFTRAGYLFVAIAHTPRTDVSRGALCTHFGITTVEDCARFKYLHWDRPHDVRAVLDYLEEQAVGPLAGMADLGQLLYAGHSAGAGSTSMVAGASRELAGMPRTLPDPRPKAFIGCSIEGPGDDGFTTTSFGAIDRPHLTLSGVGDMTPEAEALPRREPFELMMPGEKYRFWNTEPAARHSTFDHTPMDCRDYQTNRGDDVARCDEYLRWLDAAALAFADAQLRDSQAARDWLASDNLSVLTGGAVEWDRR